MADFDQIDEARKILGLGEEASLEEIKESYRNLSLAYHPDRCKDADKKACAEKFKAVTQAKELILNYCSNYRYSFAENVVRKNVLDRAQYEHLKRFYDGWFGDLGL
jgi:DnaJ-class molecular chaperone